MSCCGQKNYDGFEAKVHYSTKYGSGRWVAEVWRNGQKVWDEELYVQLVFKGPGAAYRKATRQIRKMRRAIRKGWMT
jgi:hypothetical protein